MATFTNDGEEACVDALVAQVTTFYVGIGTGVGAEAETDTILVTEVETRGSCTTSKSGTNILRNVGTVSITGTRAITEAALFDASVSGNLWIRSDFNTVPINLVSGDSIELTFDLQFE